MRGWGAVLGLLVVAALSALVLKSLPPFVFIALVVAASAYGMRVYRRRTKVSPEKVEELALGLERARAEGFGLAGLPLRLLSRGTDRSIGDVLHGPWGGLDVKLFELRYAGAGISPAEGRRFACALTALEVDVPPTMVEPRAFFAAVQEPGGLPAIDGWPEEFGKAIEVRGEDAGFASTLLDERMRSWLLELEEAWGFEVAGPWVLAYTPAGRKRDLLEGLQTLADFVDRIRRVGT